MTPPKQHRDVTETSPRHQQSITKTNRRHHRDTPRHHPSNTKPRPTHHGDKTRHDRDMTESMNFSILKHHPSTYGPQLHWFAQRCTIYKFKLEFWILLRGPIKMFINVHHQKLKTSSPKQKKHCSINDTTASHHPLIIKTSQNHHGDFTETCPRRHQHITERSPKHHQKTNKTTPKHRRITKKGQRPRHDRDMTESRNFSILKHHPSTYGPQLHWFAQRCTIDKFKLEFEILLRT